MMPAVAETDVESRPRFDVAANQGEVRVQLLAGVLADISDPSRAGVVWHRLTGSEAAALRDALSAVLDDRGDASATPAQR